MLIDITFHSWEKVKALQDRVDLEFLQGCWTDYFSPEVWSRRRRSNPQLTFDKIGK